VPVAVISGIHFQRRRSSDHEIGVLADACPAGISADGPVQYWRVGGVDTSLQSL
ncbi:MAG: hypothetical protein IIC60_01145, partial [Proteobacteria bacterium]|nr:hypothetical protein [Pseudomonadota bacterium]